MVLYPEVQRTAQEAIDRACPGRLPTFNDYDALPYIHAIAKEILRWHPINFLSKFDPLGIAEHSMLNGYIVDLPHRSTKDDTYQQFYIPEGTTVVANIWYFNPQNTRLVG